MFCGQISRQSVLDEIFKSYPNIREVYSSTNFHLLNDTAIFKILIRKSFNYSELLDKLSSVYGAGNVRVYVSCDSLSFMFNGQKIIWREGEWFL